MPDSCQGNQPIRVWRAAFDRDAGSLSRWPGPLPRQSAGKQAHQKTDRSKSRGNPATDLKHTKLDGTGPANPFHCEPKEMQVPRRARLNFGEHLALRCFFAVHAGLHEFSVGTAARDEHLGREAFNGEASRVIRDDARRALEQRAKIEFPDVQAIRCLLLGTSCG